MDQTYTCVLEEEPVADFICFPGSLGVGNLVLRVVSINEILQDTSGLEDSDLLAVSKGICDGWYAAVWVYLEEPRLLLGVLSEFDGHNFIREASFNVLAISQLVTSLQGVGRRLTQVPPRRLRS